MKFNEAVTEIAKQDKAATDAKKPKKRVAAKKAGKANDNYTFKGQRKAYVYNVAKHGDDSLSLPDSIQNVPDILVWVVPFAYPGTFSFDLSEAEVNGVTDDEALEVWDPIVIGGITQASVSTSKRAHTTSLSLQCVDPQNQYMSHISPGDWIFCSMFTNPADAARIKAAIKTRGQINDFHSGLKFVGRVQTVRRVISTNPGTAAKTRRIAITGVGFGEFDTTVYYDPALDVNTSQGELFFSQFFGKSLMTDFGAITTPAGALPRLIGALVGSGPGATYAGDMLRSPNRAFKVPGIIGKFLGTVDKEPGRSTLTYSSILTCIFGVQTYGVRGSNDYREVSSTFKENGFVPILKGKKDNAMHYYTPDELHGQFPMQLVPWVNVPIWGILNSFLMPIANEMYTCLRVDGKGRILPTYVARQIPFNTDFLQADGGQPIARFLNLPRWKIEDQQVVSYDASKSNTLRCNFVQIRSQAAVEYQQGFEIDRALNPPKRDPADISRNGLYSILGTSNNLLTNSGDARWWTKIVTDRSMGGHLKFSVQLQTIGIQEPICEGDNAEYDGLVFHIEALQHSYTINPLNGQSRFVTTIIGSNGVPADGTNEYPEVYAPPDANASSSQPATTLE